MFDSTRSLLASTLFVGAALNCAAQPAAWKPTKNVEIVVGVGPGGGVDRTARLLHKIMQERRLIEVPAIVVNKPGGGGTIAQAYLNQHRVTHTYSRSRRLRSSPTS